MGANYSWAENHYEEHIENTVLSLRTGSKKRSWNITNRIAYTKDNLVRLASLARHFQNKPAINLTAVGS